MIVDSNSAASLQYVDPTYQTSLFVRAKIYDMSGVSPVLDSFVNLLQIDNGVYAGKKVFTAGKAYVVQKLVYTDGTYTTVDQNYAQGTDDVQCIDLGSVSPTIIADAVWNALLTSYVLTGTFGKKVNDLTNSGGGGGGGNCGDNCSLVGVINVNEITAVVIPNCHPC